MRTCFDHRQPVARAHAQAPDHTCRHSAPAVHFGARSQGRSALGWLRAAATVSAGWVVACSGGTSGPAPAKRLELGGVPFGAAISASGRAWITLDSLNQVRQVDPGSGTAIGSPVATADVPTSIALTGAGTLAFVGNQDGHSVSVINTSSNAVQATIPFGTSVLGVLVPPGDSLLLVGTDYASLYLVRISTLAVIDSFPVPGVSSMAMRGDTTVFANEVFVGAVAEINLRTRQLVRTLNVGGAPQGVAVSPDGGTLYLANEIAQLQFWDLSSGTLATAVPLPGGGGFGLARRPSNGRLYVTSGWIGSRVTIIDPSTRLVVDSIQTGGFPRRIAFTADGSVGIVTNEAGWVDFIR